MDGEFILKVGSGESSGGSITRQRFEALISRGLGSKHATFRTHRRREAGTREMCP